MFLSDKCLVLQDSIDWVKGWSIGKLWRATSIILFFFEVALFCFKFKLFAQRHREVNFYLAQCYRELV